MKHPKDTSRFSIKSGTGMGERLITEVKSEADCKANRFYKAVLYVEPKTGKGYVFQASPGMPEPTSIEIVR